jgi:hypothetical protein
MAQTAVEWFYQRILAKDIKEVFEQAKAMEKEQIIDAHEEGIQRCDLEVDDFGARLVKPIEGIAGQDYYYFKYDTNVL